MRKLSVEELNRIDLKAYQSTTKHRLTVVLDNIRSLNNIGSVFRTCDAFLIEHIMLCGITGQPPHRDIHKTALGAEEVVNWSYHNTTLEAISILKEKNYKIVAVEQMDNSIMLNDFKYDAQESYALILGNELGGVSDDVIPLLDYCVEIPQYGTKHSLNISVATGVVLWDYIIKKTSI